MMSSVDELSLRSRQEHLINLSVFCHQDRCSQSQIDDSSNILRQCSWNLGSYFKSHNEERPFPAYLFGNYQQGRRIARTSVMARPCANRIQLLGSRVTSICAAVVSLIPIIPYINTACLDKSNCRHIMTQTLISCVSKTS